tara:strand:- start:941 stop:1114 length:174 start_codon:yes stop_codon:yes gene_type:complete
MNNPETLQLRLTALHMAREILTERAHFKARSGDTTVNAPSTEEIQLEAEKILTFIGK